MWCAFGNQPYGTIATPTTSSYSVLPSDTYVVAQSTTLVLSSTAAARESHWITNNNASTTTAFSGPLGGTCTQSIAAQQSVFAYATGGGNWWCVYSQSPIGQRINYPMTSSAWLTGPGYSTVGIFPEMDVPTSSAGAVLVEFVVYVTSAGTCTTNPTVYVQNQNGTNQGSFALTSVAVGRTVYTTSMSISAGSQLRLLTNGATCSTYPSVLVTTVYRMAGTL